MIKQLIYECVVNIYTLKLRGYIIMYDIYRATYVYTNKI